MPNLNLPNVLHRLIFQKYIDHAAIGCW